MVHGLNTVSYICQDINIGRGRPRSLTKVECSICSKILHSHRLRLKHYQNEHPNDKIFSCKECKYTTNYPINLKYHTDSVHEKKVRQCPQCSYNSTRNFSFLGHMRSAHGVFQRKRKSMEADHPVLCDDCGFSTLSEKQLISHKLKHCQKSERKRNSNRQCLLCKKGIEHSEHNNQLECSLCDKILHSHRLRAKHYQKEHPNDNIFSCKDCKYATNYLSNMKTHTNSIHEKKVRQCPHCSYNSTWNSAFLGHMRSAHGVFQKKSKYSDILAGI